MKRRLTLHTIGARFTTEVDHEDAEVLLERWRAVQAGDDDAQAVAQIDGLPVMHVALVHVVAIVDDLSNGSA